jgi:hypothetical protein
MRTNQLLSGFTLNSPVTWDLSEQRRMLFETNFYVVLILVCNGKIQSDLVYKVNHILKASAKLMYESLVVSFCLFFLSFFLLNDLLN